MIYVIYFFALIGFVACLATFIILGCVALGNKVSHKNDINPIHFNEPDND